MNNQETETQELTEEQTKTRKRKLLIDSGGLRAKCKACQEVGNLDRLIRHRIPVKNEAGVELYKAFEYVYFCSEACQGLWRG